MQPDGDGSQPGSIMCSNVTLGNRFPQNEVFLHAIIFTVWNPGWGEALTGDQDEPRGRALRKPGAEDMIEHRPTEDRRRAPAALDEARLRQQAIGVRLRQMFDEVVSEPVPEEFLAILRQADKKSAENG